MHPKVAAVGDWSCMHTVGLQEEAEVPGEYSYIQMLTLGMGTVSSAIMAPVLTKK